jgi:hypothetical protein
MKRRRWREREAAAPAELAAPARSPGSVWLKGELIQIVAETVIGPE